MSLGLFVVLEPTNHVFRVIEAAAARGYEVIAVTSKELDSPNIYKSGIRKVSSTIFIDGWSNEESIIASIFNKVSREDISGTYAGLEVTLPVEAALRNVCGLPGRSYRSISSLLNKGFVRQELLKKGLSDLSVMNENCARVLSEWPFPDRAAYLKPANGSGSNFVTRCEDLADLAKALSDWDNGLDRLSPNVRAHIGSGSGLILEEGCEGQLVSVEGYVATDRYIALGLTGRMLLQRDQTIEMGEIFPMNLPIARQQEILDLVGKAHQVLGIGHGATHTEVILPSNLNSAPEIVEINLRFAGADILLLMNAALGLNVAEWLVDLAVGNDPGLSSMPEAISYACSRHIMPPPGLERIDSLYCHAETLYFKQILSDKHPVVSTQYQSDTIASFGVTGASVDECLSLSRQAFKQIVLNGKHLIEDAANAVVTETP